MQHHYSGMSHHYMDGAFCHTILVMSAHTAEPYLLFFLGNFSAELM